MLRLRGFLALLCLTALVVSPAVQADWINLTGAETAPNIAEISVTEDGVRIAMELFLADSGSFFEGERFLLSVDADGESLTPNIVLREPRTRKDRFSPFAGMVDPRTNRQMPSAPDDKRVTYLDVHYRFNPDRELPGRLTLTPPLDEQGMAVATIGFLLAHKSVPVVDFRYLGQPETLQLNWDDPWYSAFENSNLVRHHRWPQMTFLYIEPREVRHESLVRVRDLMAWTDPGADVHRLLDEADQAQLQLAAEAFFADRNPVEIDGEAARRERFRAEFLEITPRGLQVIASDEPLDASVALLGISEGYGVGALPLTVDMTWELFDERARQVPTNIVDPAGPYPGFIDPDTPSLQWENFIRTWREPALEAVAAGDGGWLDLQAWRMAILGEPGIEEATRVVDALLRQFAIAYLERDPQRRRTAKAELAVEGPLTQPGSELDRIFAIPTTGGGEASIEAFSQPKIEELSEATGEDAFRALARWQARAVGRHWGHVDQRRVEFRALMDIVREGDRWKLSELTVLEVRDASG
jgi:hypothetical protein